MKKVDFGDWAVKTSRAEKPERKTFSSDQRPTKCGNQCEMCRIGPTSASTTLWNRTQCFPVGKMSPVRSPSEAGLLKQICFVSNGGRNLICFVFLSLYLWAQKSSCCLSLSCCLKLFWQHTRKGTDNADMGMYIKNINDSICKRYQKEVRAQTIT